MHVSCYHKAITTPCLSLTFRTQTKDAARLVCCDCLVTYANSLTEAYAGCFATSRDPPCASIKSLRPIQPPFVALDAFCCERVFFLACRAFLAG